VDIEKYIKEKAITFGLNKQINVFIPVPGTLVPNLIIIDFYLRF